ARLRATEGQVPAVPRLAGAEVPGRRPALRQDGDAPVARVEPADLGAASRELGLVVAVEVVDVGPLRLEVPGDLGTGEARREEDGAVAGPGRHVGSAAAGLRVAVARREPHGLPAREHAVLAAVGAADADVGPVVPRVLGGAVVDVEDPSAVG